MENKFIILTILGIGTKKSGFSDKLKKGLIKYSENTSLHNNFTVIEALPFKDANIDKNQKDIYNRLNKVNELGGILSLRKMVLFSFGDGVTFERNPTDHDSPYQRIHRYLSVKIEEANDIMQQYDNSRLVIVAASMGVHVLSTYIWDADNNKGIFKETHATSKNNLKNHSFLLTIGCNIPLFISELNQDDIIAFDKRNDEFNWENYYDRDDVLGWPLKQLSNSYNNTVTDYDINIGLYAGTHMKYWKHKKVIKPFTRKLVLLYESML